MSGNLVMFNSGKLPDDFPPDSKFYTQNINNLDKYEKKYLPDKWKNITKAVAHFWLSAYDINLCVLVSAHVIDCASRLHEWNLLYNFAIVLPYRHQ